MSRPLSLTVSALALAFAAAAPAQTLVYSHDFDSTAGWPDSDVSGDTTAVYTVVGSEYLINPLQNMTYALAAAPQTSPSPDMQVSADVRLAASQPQSRAGVACRVGQDQSFYAFDLIASGGWEIVLVRGQEAQVLRSGVYALDALESVRLQATCRGSQLTMQADGRVLGEVSDAALSSAGGAGLLSVSPVTAATNAAFDNFELKSFGTASGPNVTATLRSPPPPVASGNGGGSDLPFIDEMALYADNGAGKPGDKRSLFDAGQQRVYLVMEMEHPLPASYRAQWIWVRGTEETTVLNGHFDSPGDQRRVWLYADRAWDAGLYRVEIYANGQMLDQREFSVY